MDWISLARDRDQWWALVSTVMDLRGSIKRWEVLAQSAASQEGFSSLMLVISF
jgi:hypothetical protein